MNNKIADIFYDLDNGNEVEVNGMTIEHEQRTMYAVTKGNTTRIITILELMNLLNKNL